MEKDDRAAILPGIGQRVKQLRRETGMTQEDLAESAGLSKSFVSEVESGHAAASGMMYLKLAEALGASVEWILRGQLPLSPALPSGEVEIPRFVSKVAEEEGWSYTETLDIAAALQTIVARRTRGRRWEPSREDLVGLANAVRRLRPARTGGKSDP